VPRSGNITATSPAGRLRKKIARQLSPDVSAPSATGPPAMATVPPTAHTAIAFARRAGSGYACRTSASEAGSMTPAALPCTARLPIRNPIVGASPHAADEARNAARPAANRRFAPTRSETAPAEMSSVDDAGRALGTLQLGNWAAVAERPGLPVVCDLRSRDVAAGGQGAPLVSMFDLLLLAGREGFGPGPEGPAAAVNLGGIANLTVVDGGQVLTAYDIGPAGALMDPAASAALVLRPSRGPGAGAELDGA
jgi:hypothetical protein